MRIGCFECFSGASGDMILGAMLDAGLPQEALNEQLGLLGLGALRVEAHPTTRGRLRATKAEVIAPHEDHPHRCLADIAELIRASQLDPAVQDAALRVFRRLAEAEGKVHGRPPEEVHFHEVGALDAIADIVGAAAGMRLLNLEQVYVSAFWLGRGFVESDHGLLPLPAPATVELLRGFETVPTRIEGELVTPTGAAILTTLAAQQPPPPSAAERIGYGAGSADREELPNVLRLTIARTTQDGLPQAESDRLWMIETNVDDMPAEFCGYLYERLFAAGALEVYLTPVQMKKSRPGVLISCLAPPAAEAQVERTLFAETTTFGVRRHLVERSKLSRQIKSVATRYGEVRVKVGRLGDEVKTVAPEYEDCRRLAEQSGTPLRQVYSEAQRIAREILLSGG